MLFGYLIFRLPNWLDHKGSASHPLIQADQSIDCGSDNRLLEAGLQSIGAELPPEFAPHRHNTFAIAIEERAPVFRSDPERATQMAHDDRPSQSSGFKDVKTAKRLRQRLEHRYLPAARQQPRFGDAH